MPAPVLSPLPFQERIFRGSWNFSWFKIIVTLCQIVPFDATLLRGLLERWKSILDSPALWLSFIDILFQMCLSSEDSHLLPRSPTSCVRAKNFCLRKESVTLSNFFFPGECQRRASENLWKPSWKNISSDRGKHGDSGKRKNNASRFFPRKGVRLIKTILKSEQ